MNTNYYNKKYNIIITNDDIDVSEVVKHYKLPKTYNIYKGDLNRVAFKIREYELKHDEVFSGNLIISKLYDIDIKSIICGLQLNDNLIYVKNYKSVSHHHDCVVNDSIMFCSSMVLWIISQYSRNKYELFHNLRRSRILLKKIGII